MKSVFVFTTFALLFFLPFGTYKTWAQYADDAENNSSLTDNYYLKSAKKHLELNDYQRAVNELTLAILLDPGNAEAQALKDEAISRLKENAVLRETTKTATSVPAKTIDTSEFLKLARTAAENNRYDEAIALIEQVLETEPDNKRALYFKKRLMEIKQEAPAMAQENKDPSGTKGEAEEVIDGSVKNERPELLNKEGKTAFIQQEPDEIEPYNEEALYYKEKLNETKHKSNYENLKAIYSQEKLRSKEYLKEASVLYQDIIRFPDQKQWDGISNRKLPELSASVKENKARTELLRTIPNPTEIQFSQKIEDALSTIISFEFIDTSLEDVIAFIREKTNINMVFDANTGHVPITLRLNEVSVKTALNYLLPKGYEYLVEGDILHIYKQKMELRVYDVRDILINLDDKEPLEFDITAATSSQLSMTRGESVRVRDPSERVLDLIEMLVTAIEPSSWSANAGIIGNPTTGVQRSIRTSGQGEGSITARMGQPGDLVVVNTVFIHKQIEDVLASLRTSQNLQVNIEARFITVTDEFLEDIGTDITRFFSDNTSVSTGAADIAGDLGSGIDLNFAIFGNSALKGFLKAVQESKGSEVLTSPRITLSNTQRGNIAVLQTRNYIQSTTVEDGIVTPVIGTVPEGTTFDVRPIVSADRKFVYLEVTPSVFAIEEIESFTFSGLSEGVSVGGGDGTTYIPPEQTIQLPKLNVSQVSVTVCVPDKGTLMIGGLGSLSNKDETSGVPVLSKIPIIKRLFTRDQKTRNKSNLIILLKPTIIIKEEQERFLRLTNEKSYIPSVSKTKKQ